MRFGGSKASTPDRLQRLVHLPCSSQQQRHHLPGRFSPSWQQLRDGGPFVAVDLMCHEDGVVLLRGEGALRGEGGGGRRNSGPAIGVTKDSHQG